MSVNKINPVYQGQTKADGDTLTANEWNELTNAVKAAQNKVNEVIDNPFSGGGEGGGNSTPSTPVDTSGVISISSKGNVTLGSSKNINLEPAYGATPEGYTGNWGDIALKPGDDIQFCSHHRAPKKRDKVVIKIIDGSDNPVKMQMVAGEIEFAVGTSNNPKTATFKKDKTTGADTEDKLFKNGDAKVMDFKILTGNVLDEGTDNERDERAYLKIRAQAIDLRCEKHGGIALQPKGYDSDGNMNKIKFEHGGGDGLEFGTFNTEKTSIFTDEYRFNKNGVWKMATRQKVASDKTIIDEGQVPAGKENTAAFKYVKQEDDFYDVIDNTDAQCTTEDIIKTSSVLNGTPKIHTKITSKGNLEIASVNKWGKPHYYPINELSDELPNVPSSENRTPLFYNWSNSYTQDIDELYPDICTFDDLCGAFNLGDNDTAKKSALKELLTAEVSAVYIFVSSNASGDATGFFMINTIHYGTVEDGRYKAPNINIESESDVSIKAGGKIKLEGILDFGDIFNFGETEAGIEVQYKLTKKNATKDCGVLKVVGVNNHASNNLTVEGVTIAPGSTEVIAQCSVLDIIKLVNYFKTGAGQADGPWAPQT